MEKKIKDVKPKRVEFSCFVNSLREAGFTREQVGRSQLAVEVFNVALDLLEYRGDEVPLFLVQPDLTINGQKLVSAFVPQGINSVANRPTVVVDVSKEPLNRMLDDSFSHPFSRSSHVFEIVQAMLEEAHHFVAYTKGEMPEKFLPPGHPDYFKQRHEADARIFVEGNALRVAAKFQDFVQYY